MSVIRIKVVGTVDYMTQVFGPEEFDDDGIESKERLKEELIELAEESMTVDTTINEHDLDELWLAIKARKDGA